MTISAATPTVLAGLLERNAMLLADVEINADIIDGAVDRLLGPTPKNGRTGNAPSPDIPGALNVFVAQCDTLSRLNDRLRELRDRLNSAV